MQYLINELLIPAYITSLSLSVFLSLSVCLSLFLSQGITSDGNKDEFVNEKHSLEDLGLFTPLLKLVERQGDMEEKVCVCSSYYMCMSQT